MNAKYLVLMALLLGSSPATAATYNGDDDSSAPSSVNSPAAITRGASEGAGRITTSDTAAVFGGAVGAGTVRKITSSYCVSTNYSTTVTIDAAGNTAVLTGTFGGGYTRVGTTLNYSLSAGKTVSLNTTGWTYSGTTGACTLDGEGYWSS